MNSLSTTDLLGIGVLALLVVLAMYIEYLGRKNRKLSTLLKSKETEIARTSKLLIGKNLEMYDQNIRQQKLLESKEDFVAIVSHQLRTPATEIKWSAASLTGGTEPLTESARTQVERIRASADRMMHLIDTILRLVDLEENYSRAATTVCNPDQEIQSAASRIAEDFKDKHIGMTVDLSYKDTISSIDCDSLMMAVGNLIENAFHYTPEGGTIGVTSRKGAQNELSVEVRDSGMGITLEKQKNLFVKFRRAPEAVKLNSGGSGLGLYIVKTIVERRGGTVGFMSNPKQGSTFSFILPATSKAPTL